MSDSILEQGKTPQPTCDLEGQCQFASSCFCQGFPEKKCKVIFRSGAIVQVRPPDDSYCAAILPFGHGHLCRCLKELKRIN